MTVRMPKSAMGSIPLSPALSFAATDIDIVGGQPFGGVKAELPDGWGGVDVMT